MGEHRLKVGNDNLVDTKVQTTSTDADGKETSTRHHSRKINETEYLVRSSKEIKDGEIIELTKESNMTDEQAEDFLQEWNMKWKKQVISESEIETASENAMQPAEKGNDEKL